MATKQLKRSEPTPVAIVTEAYTLALTDEARQRLKDIKQVSDYLTQQAGLASKVSIADDESNTEAAGLLVNLTKARKDLEDLQKFFTSPLEAKKKQVIAVMKRLGADALGQEDRLRREVGDYWQKKENKRLQDAADEAAEAERVRVRNLRLGRSAPKLVDAAPVEQAPKTVATDNGSAGVSLYWGYDEVSLADVPEKYITRTVNKKLVELAIEGGERSIPGLRITQRPRVAVR